jgi:hypothetical protein
VIRVFGALVLAVLVLALLPFALLAFGGPSTQSSCGEREVTVSEANARAFDTKLLMLEANLYRGQSDQATFDESELSSRAQEFLDGSDIDVRDLRVCLDEGGSMARATGAVRLPHLPFRTRVEVVGTLDLSGEHPRLIVTDVHAGSMPGFITDRFRDSLTVAANEALQDIPLDHPHVARAEDGQLTVSGQPG